MKRVRKSPHENLVQTEGARELQGMVHGAAPASFDDVVQVAHLLRRNIVVLNLDMQNARPRNVQFQTRAIQRYGWQTSLLVYLEVRPYSGSIDTYLPFIRC